MRLRTMLLASVMSIVSFPAASADESAPDPAPASGAEADESTVSDSDVAEVDTVIVTGTRVVGRTVSESAVPIDVISAEALTNNGLTETNKILSSLVPSFNFPQPSITDGTAVIRPATLRGLSPDQTLVLVNGKRRHVSSLLNINNSVGRGSAAVDLNLIPALAVERIEVLRDGASSQYGSDAIAGVINFQLKKAREGGRVVVSYGKYVTTLDGVANVTGLQTNSAGQPMLDPADTRIFLANSDGEREARDGALTTFAANIGIALGEGYVNLTAEYRDRQPTNRAAYDLRPNYNRASSSAPFDPLELSFDRLNFKSGDAQTEDYNFFFNGGAPVTEELEFYAFGSYGKREGLSAANYRQSRSADNRDYSVLAPSTTPNAANFVPLRRDGFLPNLDTDLKDLAGTVGLRGAVAEWNSDLSVGHGNNRFDYRVVDTLNTSFGPESQSEFDAGGLEFGQWQVNLDVAREFDVGFSSPLSIALGAEYRNEEFQITPGEFQSYAAGPYFRASFAGSAVDCSVQGGVYDGSTGICSFPARQASVGSQAFPGFPPSSATDVGRDSYASYVELDSELFESFTAAVAGRYEHFSDFGDTLNGKLALRYEVIDGYSLRGSVSNGFRAPSLHQQFFTTTSTNVIAGLPVEVSTLPVDSPVARALGSKDLEPEKSINLSIGATACLFRGFNLTVDYYRIDIDDRIVLTENLGATGTGTTAQRNAVKAILDANGFESVGAARFFINGIDTRTEGVDIIGSYQFDAQRWGEWGLTAALNLNKSKIAERRNDLGPLAAIPDLVLFGRLQGLRFTDGQPENKLVVSAEGEIGALGITLRTTRYGEVLAPDNSAPLADPTSLTALGPDDQVLSPEWVTDLELRYTLSDNWELAIGANNLFDVYPDRRPTGRRPDGGLHPESFNYVPYSVAASPFGVNGRFLYARASMGY